jgi:integrase
MGLDPYAIAAIRLLLLTGARLREVLHARWDWFDAERGMLLLPDSKTDEKSIYLSSAALSILNELPRIHGNMGTRIYFPARQGTKTTRANRAPI